MCCRFTRAAPAEAIRRLAACASPESGSPCAPLSSMMMRSRVRSFSSR